MNHKVKKMQIITSLWVSIIIGFLAVLSLWGSLQAAIPAEERAALIALYNATGGDNWTNQDGWKTPPLHTDGFALPGTEGDWDGAVVSGDHVIGIFLSNNQLNGSIPPELGNFSNLEDLKLGSNQLSGSIPPELGNLSNLQYLYLYDNQLSGSIPPELGNLSNLEVLELRHNQLSGSIPPELGKLSNLGELDLSENQLNGSIPPELGNLSNLWGLYLCTNQLSGSIPQELGNLSNLGMLNLSENQLSGSIPAELGNLSILGELYLYSNRLSGSIPAELGNLPMEWLSLSNNRLSGRIPPELGNIKHLAGLGLSNNRLSGSIPPELGNLSHLEGLSLDNNQLSGSIPQGLEKLSELRFLYLNNNKLSGEFPYFKCLFVRILDISYNCLYATDPAVRAWLNCLDPDWELHQDQCAPPAIPAKERAALIALYNATAGDNWLYNEGWKTPPLHTDGFSLPGTEGNWAGVEVSADHVVKLDEVKNDLKGCIPPELGNLSNLQELRLFSNALNGSIPPELGNLSNLMVLYLDNNHLSGSIPAELGNLSNLKHLTLHTNQLSGSIPAELGNLSNLVHLMLNKNQLSGSILPEFGNLSNLNHLYLNNNQLSGSIPPGLGNLTQLTSLSLGNNILSGEIPPGLKNLTNIINLDIGYNCLFAIDTALRNWLNIHDPDWELHQDQCTPLGIRLNRTQLYFSVTTAGTGTTEQKVQVDSSGGGMLTWTGNADSSWLSLTPTSGRGPGVITVSINPTGLEIGDYTDTITVSDPDATNSPQAVSVFLKVYQDSETQTPFGEFSTPLDGTTVSSSIPVTGWALDDIEVIKVEIFSGETYVGDAVFVEGARPDVELVYPGYPRNYRAGWGYMLLTNFLPGGGNGTYTLEARAIDAEGHQVTLGTKTIIVDNAHAVKPFGAIDTPGQGGTAAGSAFINWGWVLTPQPNRIPNTGETIDVYVDGINLGHPVYNLIRTDVASLFPGYANSGRAGGFFTINTTAYDNGIHSISWVATDDVGNRDGIGSRYFSIENLDSSKTLAASYTDSHKQYTPQELEFIPVKDMEPVQIARGIEKDGEAQEVFPGNTGNGRAVGINLKELEPVEIHLGENIADMQGYMVVDGQRRDLPIGSTLDRKTGKFYWMPGPGYIGTYELEFVIQEIGGQCYRRKLEITIEPKFPGCRRQK